MNANVTRRNTNLTVQKRYDAGNSTKAQHWVTAGIRVGVNCKIQKKKSLSNYMISKVVSTLDKKALEE